MIIIKIISNDRKSLIQNISGEYVNLPEDSNEINSFIYPKDIKDKTLYIIEISPDDKNPLNYNGVKIAMQLYFKHLQENKFNFFIKLIGFESTTNFFFDCEYSNFLKCPNVVYQQIILEFKLNDSTDIISVDPYKAIDLLKKININPPKSYKTHHSISNEWAISRWSQYLGFNNRLDTEIEKSLYFQYLKTIYQIDNIQSNNISLNTNGNLLLIDDEEAKGWSDFINNLKLPSSALKIESIGKDFKKLEAKNAIIDECEEKIRQFKPQTIILDLRLHDSDFEEDNPSELTGFKILKKIKEEINPGIQVILFTASNKVWNYQALNKIGFDGWITKENPEFSSDASYTKLAINEIKKQIEFCQKRAPFLIKVYDNIIKLKNLIEENKFFDIETKNKFKSNLDISFKLLEKATQSEDYEKYYNYAYLELFLIIENWLKHESVIKKENGSYYVINLDKHYPLRKPTNEKNKYDYSINWNKKGFYIIEDITKENLKSYEDTMFKMSGVLLFKFNVQTMEEHEWGEISKVRNQKAAHTEKSKVTKEEISTLIKYVIFLFNPKNHIGKKESNKDDLKKKFNSY